VARDLRAQVDAVLAALERGRHQLGEHLEAPIDTILLRRGLLELPVNDEQPGRVELERLDHALGFALLPDEQYVEAMQAINATVRNGVFAFSFFGVVLFLLMALAVHIPRLRSRRFALIALAAVFYIGGGFMMTFLVNVPMNEELARVGEVGLAALAQVRAEYEGPWNFWNGVRTVFSSLAFVAIIGACLSRSDGGARQGSIRNDS
jgi:uncharacterized membrane protein